MTSNHMGRQSLNLRTDFEACIHLSEVPGVTSQMLERVQKHQAAVQRRLRAEVGDAYSQPANECAEFQVQRLRSLNVRSNSNNERLQKDITLAWQI